jgi:hypothetical protein
MFESMLDRKPGKPFELKAKQLEYYQTEVFQLGISITFVNYAIIYLRQQKCP